MLVNPRVMFSSWQVVVFGLAVTAAAVIGKLIGCGGAALATGFNGRGAYRIGLGMLPRGEVALIVAGIGLSRQLVGEVVFGVSILMTLVTTVVAPVLLVPAFARGGSGRESDELATPGREPARSRLPSTSIEPGFEVRLPPGLLGDFVDRFLELAQKDGWLPAYDRADEEIYLLRNGDDAAQLAASGGTVRIATGDRRKAEVLDLIERVRRSLIDDAERVSVQANRAS